MEAEELSEAIVCLYDAAMDPSLWPAALEKTCHFVGGVSANIFWQDAATNAAAVFHAWGGNSEYDRLYFETYANLNPFFPALAFVGVGKVVSGCDLIPHHEFHETRFYLEWVKPQGLVDVIGVNLDRTATSTAFMSIRRHERHGLVDDEMRRRFALIVPHAERAVAIGNVIQASLSREGLFKRVLEGIAAAVVLVTSDGRIIFANQSAEDYFTSRRVIANRRGTLMAADPAADKALREAFMLAERGDAALGLKGIHVPLASGDDSHHIAHVLSLVSESRRDEENGQAVAALFVRQVTMASPSPLEAIASRYSLTPSELRVLAAVLDSGSVDDLAQRLGVAKATVKTHLNRLLAKTGSRRQADLVRLAAGYGNATSVR